MWYRESPGSPFPQDAPTFINKCIECLTDEELARICAPAALFVVEQLLKAAKPESKDFVYALAHVRASLIWKSGHQLGGDVKAKVKKFVEGYFR
jgi:hypothetical protein